MRDTVQQAIRWILFLTLPTAIVMIVLRRPIVNLLFQYGSFGPEARELTQAAFLFYSLGLAGHALVQILARVYFASRDTQTPLALTLFSIGANVVLSAVRDDTGKLIGTVTIGCAIGFGNPISASPGSPTYVEDGYVVTGYQFYENQIEVLPAGDVGYTVPIDAPNDDGLVFPLTRVPFLAAPEFHSVDLSAGMFDGTVDLSNPDGAQAAKTAIDAILNAKRCHLDFTIAPVSGQTFDNSYDVVLTDLVVPKMIDLEAGS